MSLNTVVREKRKALGLTQEQVAAYLGVTAPAVNKWEKGATYPDITLLPALARLLKTDPNTLLCFGEGLSAKEITLFIGQLGKTLTADGYAGAFGMAMGKVRQYPACPALLHQTAMFLQGSLMMFANLPPAEAAGYDRQITTLYERVAAGDDPDLALRARHLLASRYIKEKAYDKAQELVDALPPLSALDKKDLQIQLWMAQGEDEQAGKALRAKTLSTVHQLLFALVNLSGVAARAKDDAAADQLTQCAQSLVAQFGLWPYDGYLVPLELAVNRRDAAAAVAVLSEMLPALLRPWTAESSPLFGHGKLPQQATGDMARRMLPSLLSDLEQDERYDFLRDVPEFRELVAQYRAEVK